MSRVVCKFGGTSVADAGQFRRVRTILGQDPRRRIVVPSAPGKRAKSEAKITDLLYLCFDMAAIKANFSQPFEEIRARYLEIACTLGLQMDFDQRFDAFYDLLNRGTTRDYAASRGEYFNGLLIAKYLDAEFVDPQEYISILPSGTVDPKTYAALGARLNDEQRMYVVPGFYGRDRQGNVKTFSRGGSDISGAIVARAVNAELYENWTDVSGFLMADPRIVSNPHPMQEVTYREIRELSYMGANVFHDEAIVPVIEAGIPICIKNTNDPTTPRDAHRSETQRQRQQDHRDRWNRRKEGLLDDLYREKSDEQGVGLCVSPVRHHGGSRHQRRALPFEHRWHQRYRGVQVSSGLLRIGSRRNSTRAAARQRHTRG